MLFVGERRSETAVRQGWTWTDGRLAAKPSITWPRNSSPSLL